MCIRPEVQSDSSFIQLVLRERSSEKRALPTEEEPPQNQNLADINNRLDDFLAMFEDEDEDAENAEEESNNTIVSLCTPFTCVFCHGSETDGEENMPVLLGQFSERGAHGILVLLSVIG